MIRGDVRRNLLRGTVIAASVLTGLLIAYLVPNEPRLALLIAIVVLALGISAVDAAIIPLLALPFILLVSRIGAGGIDLSVSDAALIACTGVALVFARRPFSRDLINALWLTAIYQFATLFTVLVNQYRANTVEWVHAWFLVGGALLMGWTIGRAGYARIGLTILTLFPVLLAVVTLGQAALQYATGNFDPVYVTFPFPMHKNYVGTVLGFAAVIAYVNPRWMKWPRVWAQISLWLLVGGIAVTQSRQAIIGLGIALLVVAWRERRQGRRPWVLALFAVVPAFIVVLTMVQEQVESGNEFNSVFQRTDWLMTTFEFWLTSPWVGHGLRYWYLGIPGMEFQPPNAELEVLASAGLVGLAGFLLLMIGALVICWKMPPAFGTLAFAILLSRLVQAQFDLFWTAVQTSVPFLVVGICMGIHALRDAEYADHTQESAKHMTDLLPSHAQR